MKPSINLFQQSPETRALAFLSLSLLLSGCGSYSASFDCPIGEGLTCASLSEVNQKIDQGGINLGFPSEQREGSCPSCQTIHGQTVYWRSDLAEPLGHHGNKER